jgi:WASH complex subunit 7
MRALAREKFHLEIIPSHLPPAQLEQGIDILQLLRELSKFVSKYNYNLHTQVFVETTVETKQIKTIGVGQMLASIKTHGIGVMGTVINTFYKFLVKKLNVFNEFLYDEFIQNPLMQEQRWYRKNKEKTKNQYPYERAERIARDIRRLGTTKGGVTYLDKFRQLITQIGNVLGFVRMIRSASLKDNANLIKYLPSFIEEIRFEDVATELGVQGETMQALKVLDMCIRNLFKQADEAGDYLRMIVRNFDGMLEQEEVKHLKVFYLIVPALTLSQIEHIQKGNERIMSKNKNVGGFISDDGFSVGVTYLLKILKQSGKFGGLNWFDAIFAKLRRDNERVGEGQGKDKYGDDLTEMAYED